MGVDVFLIEDDEAVRESLHQVLELANMRVRSFSSMERALENILGGDEPLVVVTDVRLKSGRGDGIKMLRAVGAHDEKLPVILITGHGDVTMAVMAMREGAHDFLEKPFSATRLVAATRRAIERRALVLENRALQRSAVVDADFGLLGETPVMKSIRQAIHTLGPAHVDVLILGETGTGKEVVARALHTAGAPTGPFVAINCSAVPEAIFETEMFGHEAGAFAGSGGLRIGKIEHAQGGTVFLDEIEALPLQVQAKLLRTVQERTIERLGSNQPVAVTCRFIAAAKNSLIEATQRGLFRSDLYYRLEMATLRLPLLRERVDDIPLLFSHFLAQTAQKHGIHVPEWSTEDMLQLKLQPWPGNVRELRNLAERCCLRLDRAIAQGARRPALVKVLEDTERSLIELALQEHGGNVQLAAEQLVIPRKTLYDKMKRFNINSAALRSANVESTVGVKHESDIDSN